MRIFHVVAFEGVVNRSVRSSHQQDYAQLFGQMDMLHISGFCVSPVGASPALTISLEGTIDLNNWVALDTPATLATIAVSPTGETLFQGQSLVPGSSTKYPYVRLQLNMSVSTDSTYAKVWVTGRDSSKAAHGMIRPVQ